MIFEKDGERWEVTDPAHIDCFRAKGWHEVSQEKKPKKPSK